MIGTSLPPTLVKALVRRQYLPIVGWGYPDFMPAIVKGTRAVDQRYQLEDIALSWITVAGPHVWPLYQAGVSQSTQGLVEKGS